MTPRDPDRPTGLRDETGSMALYLVIAVVGLALSALMVPMIITSSNITRSDTSRTRSLDAAQAGLNAVVGAIRSATTDQVGTVSKLPCAPISGNVGNGATYSASVVYYVDDPVAIPAATPMRCAAGYGTYDPVSGTFTPRYARITSVGKDSIQGNGATQGRTLQSTYVFRITNTNIAGGPIRIYPPDGGQNMCMDAGSGAPIAGTRLLLQPCATPVGSAQTFAYRSDLTLQLVSSVTPAYPDGVCLDMADRSSGSSQIVFAACGTLGSPPYSQQWSFNDNGNFEAATATSTATGGLAGRCISAATQNAGQDLRLGGCGGTTSQTSAWIPSPAAGAGGAQPPQLINYYEFGRCLDVTDQNVGKDHLIAYPCKQNPSRAQVTWNQKWTLPAIANGASSATGPVKTVPGAEYCLASPGTAGGYVVTKPCDSSSLAQKWTVYNGNGSLTYSQKYRIVDSSGQLCLGLTGVYGSEKWSAIDVEPCTGATELKWNANADLTSSALQDLREIRTP